MGKVEIAGIVAVRVHDGLYQSEYGELSVERQEDGEWLASYFQIDCHIIVPGASAQDAAKSKPARSRCMGSLAMLS